MKPSDFIIPVPTVAERRQVMTELRDFLQKTDEKFSVRALRRGTLQALGQDPANGLEVVMAFAGHTRTETSLRYTNRGRQLRNRRRGMADAAATTLTTARA